MYFPIGWPKSLHIPQEDSGIPVYVVSNRDRSLFAIITTSSLCLWFCKPAVQIISFRRSKRSVSDLGCNEKAEWRPDSSMIAITTTKGCLIFYKLELDDTVGNHQCIYSQKEAKKTRIRKDIGDILSGDGIPALKLTQVSYTPVEGGVASILCIRDELLLTTKDGMLHRMKWDSNKNSTVSVNIKTIPFSIDLQFSRACTIVDIHIYISHIEYSPLLGGFAVVMSSGKAAFLTVQTVKFEAHQIQGVWAQEVTDASCVAINHKYRLIAYGRKSGEASVYSIDELTGALQVSHHMTVSSKDYPDASHIVGKLQSLKWTPDGSAIVGSWQRGGLCLWSVFGSLLFCSLGGEYGLSEDAFKHHSLHIKSMEWGAEGYHLWIMSEAEDNCYRQTNSPKKNPSANNTNNSESPLRDLRNDSLTPGVGASLNGPQDPDLGATNGIQGLKTEDNGLCIVQLQFVKSALAVNPCMNNCQHVFLQGEDRLYLSTGDFLAKAPDTCVNSEQASIHVSYNETSCGNPSPLLGSKQWQIIGIPYNYLASNWPIRYTAVDKSSRNIAIAGKYGLAHYTVSTRKWKLFGNETQEKDMVVSGGLTWWKDFICLACYNLLDQRDEIRIYPYTVKLDNAFAQVTKVPSQILLLNIYRDTMVVLCADCHLMLFGLQRKHTLPNTPSVTVTKLQEVAIGNFIPHPASVVAITLSSLRTEMVTNTLSKVESGTESILMNVSGKLLLFQRDRSTNVHVKVTDGKQRPVPFCSPVMVASCVEAMWMSPRATQEKRYLMDALWLSCGIHGMKVWLPLFPKREADKHGFLSKRIMLPFKVDIVPLAVLFEDAVILGCSNDGLCFDLSNNSDTIPFLTLERTSQIYLQHILRQLLRRNLGFHALEIAKCCTDLPYFSHCLELLLHEVLEEEATSKEPIPDPLLPRVLAFIQEFPQFLETIVHCARKTEVALWQYLFLTAGNPTDLFQECLNNGKLVTAGTYLIILQNLHKASVSRSYATNLLELSLEKREWDLARDLVRFLKAIDPMDVGESPNELPSLRLTKSYRSPPLTPEDSTSSAFQFSNEPVRSRHMSISKTEPYNKELTGIKEKIKATKSDPSAIKRVSPGREQPTEGATDELFIDVILHRHARRLLSSYKLRDLASFASNMENYQLVSWLRRERLRAAIVEDFVAALKKLHQDFQWPFPIMTHSSFYHLHTPLRNIDSSSPSISSNQESGINGSEQSDDVDAISNHFHRTLLASSPDLLTGHIGDVMLKPKIIRDDSSLTTTELSDSCSALGDQDLAGDPTNSWMDTSVLEQISQELANKGPNQSEVELRFLLQIMMESDCLEWAILISILLRDAMSVVRTVNVASLIETKIEVVGRIREGMSYLELWAETECFGYKPFFQAIKGQTMQLNQIVEQNLATSKFDAPKSPDISMTTMDFRLAGFHGNSSPSSGDQGVVLKTDDTLIEKDEDVGSCAIT